MDFLVPLRRVVNLVLFLAFVAMPGITLGAKNLLFIGWDGADRWMIEEEMAKGNLPNLKSLALTGSYLALKVNHGLTDTKRGWAAILTGIHPDIVGIYGNNNYRPVPDGLTVFEKLKKADPSLTLGWISGKGGNVGMHCLKADPPFGPFANVCEEIEESNRYEARDEPDNSNIAQRGLDFLNRNQGGRFALFLLFQNPDVSGHECELINGDNEGYRYSVTARPGYGQNGCRHRLTSSSLWWGYGVDYWLGQLVNRLQSAGQMNNTIVIVTTDHGFNRDFATYRGHASSPDTWMVSSPALKWTGSDPYTSNIARWILKDSRLMLKPW